MENISDKKAPAGPEGTVAEGGLPDRHDVSVLRGLAEWQASEADSARNRAKIEAWLAHDAGLPQRRPMVIFEIRNWDEGQGPVNARDLLCKDPWCRALEYRMRMLRHHIEILEDDHVATPYIRQYPIVERGGFGVECNVHREAGANRHSYNLSDAPLSSLDEKELARLRLAKNIIKYDEMRIERRNLEYIFADILPVQMRDRPWQFQLPLTSLALKLVGQEQFMLLMYDNPDGLHRLMAFLSKEQMSFLDLLETEHVLPPNHGADYIGAGSVGFTKDLPASDYNGHIRARDRWGGFESQESVSISPEQYGEFVFPYLQPLMARFGKIYYGCCEPVNLVWPWLARVPNLARVSVSPWADEEETGRLCRTSGIVYSRKPSPNYLSFEKFDETALRDHLLKTADCACGCSLEIIQRDMYTTYGHPERLQRWVALAREAVATVWHPWHP